MKLIGRLLALGFVVALAACNTVEGLGRDVRTGGDAITDSAQDAQAQF
jgi:predicted small secreted protein